MKAEKNGQATVLLADDDDDFCMLARKAIERAGMKADLHVVGDGEEAIRFLLNEESYANVPKPDLILLDLNMPRKDGRAALKDIRGSESVGAIPVVVLTTSRAERDVFASYRNGANSFISKPDSFNALVEIMSAIDKYWFQTVALPGRAT